MSSASPPTMEALGNPGWKRHLDSPPGVHTRLESQTRRVFCLALSYNWYKTCMLMLPIPSVRHFFTSLTQSYTTEAARWTVSVSLSQWSKKKEGKWKSAGKEGCMNISTGMQIQPGILTTYLVLWGLERRKCWEEMLFEPFQPEVRSERTLFYRWALQTDTYKIESPGLELFLKWREVLSTPYKWLCTLRNILIFISFIINRVSQSLNSNFCPFWREAKFENTLSF